MSTSVQVDSLPPCDFCQMEGALQRGETPRGVYDAKTSQGPWANMCHKHYMAHRAFTELGTGRGQKLFLPSPDDSTRQRPRPAHLERLQDLLREHGSLAAVLDSTDELGIG